MEPVPQDVLEVLVKEGDTKKLFQVDRNKVAIVASLVFVVGIFAVILWLGSMSPAGNTAQSLPVPTGGQLSSFGSNKQQGQQQVAGSSTVNGPVGPQGPSGKPKPTSNPTPTPKSEPAPTSAPTPAPTSAPTPNPTSPTSQTTPSPTVTTTPTATESAGLYPSPNINVVIYHT